MLFSICIIKVTLLKHVMIVDLDLVAINTTNNRRQLDIVCIALKSLKAHASDCQSIVTETVASTIRLR